MSTMTLDERGAILEQELLALKQQIPKPAGVPWRERISGVFADTLAFDEVVAFGPQYRASQCPQEREQ